MFTQIFRTKLSQDSQLRDKFDNIEKVVMSNIDQPEPSITKSITGEWKKKNHIYLGPFWLDRQVYYLWVEFRVLLTHSRLIRIEDVAGPDLDTLWYQTECGDIGVLVEYLLDDRLVNRKLSIVQTKKEAEKDRFDIPLNQLFMMTNWPRILSKRLDSYNFEGVNPDQFSFYHFVLNYSYNRQYTSSIVSAPMVSYLLHLNERDMANKLLNWLRGRRTDPSLKAPSERLYSDLTPGSIHSTRPGLGWDQVPKSFSRFLRDAAYLFVGTDNENLVTLMGELVSNVLVARVIGRRESEETARNRDSPGSELVNGKTGDGHS
jgi:hypothetical protein